jgi:hypothetical protein
MPTCISSWNARSSPLAPPWSASATTSVSIDTMHTNRPGRSQAHPSDSPPARPACCHQRRRRRFSNRQPTALHLHSRLAVRFLQNTPSRACRALGKWASFPPGLVAAEPRRLICGILLVTYDVETQLS